MSITIRHLDGPLKGLEQHFDDSVAEIIIGRSPDCQVVFPPEYTEISKKHVALRRNPAGDYAVELFTERYVEIDGILARNGQVASSGSVFVLGRPGGPSFSVRYASEMADIAWTAETADADTQFGDFVSNYPAEPFGTAVDLLVRRKSTPPAVVAGVPADASLQRHLESEFPVTEMRPAPPSPPVRVGASDRPAGTVDPWFDDLLQGKHSPPTGVGSGGDPPPTGDYPEAVSDELLRDEARYNTLPESKLGGRAASALLWWVLLALGAGLIGYWLFGRGVAFGAALGKLLPAAVPPPPAPKRKKADLVDVSVFGPTAIQAGGEGLVQVFLHQLGQRELAKALAQEVDPEATRRGVQTLAAEIAEGQHVQIVLEGRGMDVDQEMQTLVWRSEPCACQFTLTAPKQVSSKTFHPRVLVLVDSVPVGSITFALKVSKEETAAIELRGDRARRYSYAFLSYASPDRAEVIKRAQGLKAGGTSFFNDLLSLEPGERWEKRLYEEIDRCDVFYLFWSSHAKTSEWVMKEIEHALDRRKSRNGDPDIIPVIIEGPPPPAPPESLKDIHFNDSLLYVLAGA